jgi:hypothetical protein
MSVVRTSLNSHPSRGRGECISAFTERKIAVYFAGFNNIHSGSYLMIPEFNTEKNRGKNTYGRNVTENPEMARERTDKEMLYLFFV